LPAGVTREMAIEVNRRAARWDGIASVEADGTIRFTDSVQEVSERALGMRLTSVSPGEQDAVASEMLERARTA